MSKTLEQVRQELDAKIPREEVSTRDGGRSKLSYLEGHYVIDRLNKIFGPEGWSYDTEDLTCVHSGQIKNARGEDVWSASYTAQVSLYVIFPGSEQAKRIREVGFGNGRDKLDPGQPHELAVKEAVTDAVKRGAKSLGMSLGLALYSKDQENVEDAPNPKIQYGAKDLLPAKIEDKDIKSPNRDILNRQITAEAKVVAAKGKRTLDETRAYMQSKYKKEKAAELSDTEAKELLAELKGLSNG